MATKLKTEREQQLLVKQQKEDQINTVLKFSRKRFKKFNEVILRLYSNEDLSAYFADRRIAKIHQCFNQITSVNRKALKEVFIYLDKQAVLLSGEEHIHAVFNMVKLRAYWLRDIYEWKPMARRSSLQLKELADYLFCRYPVPGFMYKAFFESTNMRYMYWFLDIGTGYRVKTMRGLPFAFTQKMAHYFLQVPERFSIPEALRWAQVRGLGGDERLAERVAYSWLGTKPYSDEEFWEAFLRVLVNGGMFDYDHLTELIDYVNDAKRVNPDYSLKGRTLASLLRQTEEWHRKDITVRGVQHWHSCGINGYKAVKKDEVLLVEELTGSKLLADEGRRMKHCVATYVHYCMDGRTAIFSMRKYLDTVPVETLATIEVNISLKRIVQAKAKMNQKISAEARMHLEEWAFQNGLSFSPYV